MSGTELEGAQLVLIRHAPIAEPGRLCGRTDVAACIDPIYVAQIAPDLAQVPCVVTSPALRCRQTAAALWPGRTDMQHDPRLWEQDFGDHDGQPFDHLPDIGTLGTSDLAKYRSPNGESFWDVATRIAPALAEWSERARETATPVALVVHAGVIRAALGLTLGTPEVGLGFEIANLSITRLRVGPDGPSSIIDVNQVAR